MLLVLYFIVLMLAAGFLALQAARQRERGKKTARIYAVCFGLLLGYLSAELVVTAYYRLSWRGTTLFLFDESGRTVHFDPVRGYLLTTQASRFSRITNGMIEYVGSLQGNSQGFPSRYDFTSKRPDADTRRIAVFGDSFSAGQYLNINWPDRAQALAQAHGDKLQFLNFAVDGAGLANWWSVLTRLVAPEHYDLDGIVFVVFEANLERKFVVSEHRGYKRHMFGRCDSWDPKSYPRTLEEAKSCLQEVRGAYILSDGEFAGALRRQWPPSVPRPQLQLVIAKQLLRAIDEWRHPTRDAERQFSGFNPQQKQLVEDIHQFVSRRDLPVLVVFLPSRDRLVKSAWENDAWRKETKAFAEATGATFLDGSDAFAHMQPEEIRKCFLPYDYHWNQSGSDRFAQYMLDQIHMAFHNRPQTASNSSSDQMTWSHR